MKTILRCTLCLLFILISGFQTSFAKSVKPLQNYTLIAHASLLTFTAIKDSNIPVTGFIQGMTGEAILTDKGQYQIKFLAPLLKLSTNNPERDKRIKELFFETSKNPAFQYALWYSKTKLGDKKLSGELTIHDVRIPVSGNIDFSYPKANQIIVETTSPLILSIAHLKLNKQLTNLIQACGHKSVDDKVEIEFKLLFEEINLSN